MHMIGLICNGYAKLTAVKAMEKLNLEKFHCLQKYDTLVSLLMCELTTSVS